MATNGTWTPGQSRQFKTLRPAGSFRQMEKPRWEGWARLRDLNWGKPTSAEVTNTPAPLIPPQNAAVFNTPLTLHVFSWMMGKQATELTCRQWRGSSSCRGVSNCRGISNCSGVHNQSINLPPPTAGVGCFHIPSQKHGSTDLNTSLS